MSTAVKPFAPTTTSTIHPISKPEPGKLKFAHSEGFQVALRRRVDRYFNFTGLKKRDCPQMYIKTAILLAWLATSYALLVFLPAPWWVALILAIMVGLMIAAVGFSVQHDGGHGAYSDRPWVNRIMAMTIDLLGASSYVWAKKHNVIHHSYTNVTGHDDDINLGIFGRLSPHQKRYGFHRVQHFYTWFLYGFLSMKWQLVDDFINVITGKIGEHKFARPRGRHLVTFIGGKTIFFSLAFVIPMFFHPAWAVVVYYASASFVAGVALSIIFQLAHCVEEAEFPMPSEDTGRMENAWAEHQIQTTVDFARNNRVLSWFVGGLNFQVEHHLFPQICHIHYPKLARIVESTCEKYGLRYSVNESFFGAIGSHFRWLRRMGRG